MVNFQTHFEKYPLSRARQRPGGAAGGGARGTFSKNEPYLAHPIFKIAIWLVYHNFTIW